MNLKGAFAMEGGGQMASVSVAEGIELYTCKIYIFTVCNAKL